MLWRNSATGENYVFLMDGLAWRNESAYTNSVAPAWSVAQIGDFDGDGRMDILWRNAATGENYIAFMNGPSIKSSSAFSQSVSPAWVTQILP